MWTFQLLLHVFYVTSTKLSISLDMIVEIQVTKLLTKSFPRGVTGLRKIFPGLIRVARGGY